ncbi:LacI family DNA-binding transcriptional regulator [Geminisphaera colitermitum]|uniref:LacI family DNA-binding transcriptional regulator n=1 Tax=Geminisphaera colitermitum TaxID=1148786 RepID=UPI000196500A|nr:LacI family DNA-binding transcriptional regulator [Geminisphaera colitermitum]
MTGLKSIADKAGVSRMTVSRALRNSPLVNAVTRKRILQIARKMGYTPDARLAQTMAGIRGSKQKALLPIAWLHANLKQDAFHAYKWLTPYIDGAREQARELGYRVEEFWLGEAGMSGTRMSSILNCRGITGVVVCPSMIPSISHIRMDWRLFAAVSFEGAMLVPRLHRVVPDYYYNMLLTLKMLRRLGYRRIGLYLHRQEERRSHHRYLSAFRHLLWDIPESERIPPLTFEPFDQKALGTWLKKTRPDVLVGHDSRLISWLENTGRCVPEDIGVAHLSLDGDCEDWAGIWQHKRRIGAQAVEQLVSLIHNNRLGLPDIAYETLVPGEWRFGKTLLRRTV